MTDKLKNMVFYVLYLGLVVFLIGYLVFNDYGILKYLKLKNEISELANEIKKTEDSITILEVEIDSLNHSLNKIEEVGRENHHMLKREERAYYIQEN